MRGTLTEALWANEGVIQHTLKMLISNNDCMDGKEKDVQLQLYTPQTS
jgi:hypothetical protein